MNKTQSTRPNTYAGTCSDCRKQVTKMAGLLGPKVAGSWTVHHKGCAVAVAPRKQVRSISRYNGQTGRCVECGATLDRNSAGGYCFDCM